MFSTTNQALTELTTVIRWTTLRSIGNSPAAKLTILIPLIGYLHIFNNSALEFLRMSKLFSETANGTIEGVSKRLLTTYFALCYIAVGSIVYTLACPIVIKRHSTSVDFIAADGESHGVQMLVRMSTELGGEDDENVKFKEYVDTLDTQRKKNNPESISTYREEKSELEADGLDLYFNYMNVSRPLARIACAVFYAWGLSILAVQSIEVFMRASGLLALAK